MLLKENIQRLQGEYCPNFDRFLYFIEIAAKKKKKKKKKKALQKKTCSSGMYCLCWTSMN